MAGSALVYLVGAPSVHAFHGNRRQVGRSLGRRVFLPMAGAVAGYAAVVAAEGPSCEGDLCGLAYAFGAVLGGGVAMMVASGWDVARAVTPVVMPTSGGASAGAAIRW